MSPVMLSIPKMQVRTLQVEFDDSLEGFKPGLLSAVKANSTLYKVAGEKYGVELDHMMTKERERL